MTQVNITSNIQDVIVFYNKEYHKGFIGFYSYEEANSFAQELQQDSDSEIIIAIVSTTAGNEDRWKFEDYASEKYFNFDYYIDTISNDNTIILYNSNEFLDMFNEYERNIICNNYSDVELQEGENQDKIDRFKRIRKCFLEVQNMKENQVLILKDDFYNTEIVNQDMDLPFIYHDTKIFRYAVFIND